ncbi:MAG: 50S ribosomal protein L9 [Candidatus Pacebacteria bacterium]|nr:50S ribosomal protein L9 [Candidatus Paceibacterota bacterium]
MKVILLQDVAKIGRRSELVEVPNGYALNKLIPKNLAEAATPSNMKRIVKLQAEVQANKEADVSRYETAVKALKGAKIEFAIEVNEKGHSFKAVNEADIVDAAKTAGVDIDVAMISVAAPIKELGQHEVTLAQGADKSVFKIEVIKK